MKDIFAKLLGLFTDEQIAKDKKEELLNSIVEPDEDEGNEPEQGNPKQTDQKDNSREFLGLKKQNAELMRTNSELQKKLDSAVEILNDLKKDREEGKKLLEQKETAERDKQNEEYIASIKSKKVVPAQNEEFFANLKELLKINPDAAKKIVEQLPNREEKKEDGKSVDTSTSTKSDDKYSTLLSVVSPEIMEQNKKYTNF